MVTFALLLVAFAFIIGIFVGISFSGGATMRYRVAKLVLEHLAAQGILSGREIQDFLALHVNRLHGVAFYAMMAKLEDADLITSWWETWDVEVAEGNHICRRRMYMLRKAGANLIEVEHNVSLDSMTATVKDCDRWD